MESRHSTRREIEIKLPVKNFPIILEKLRLLRARPFGRIFERNIVFDTPDSCLRRHGRLLRLRLETGAPKYRLPGGPGRTLLTSKAPVVIVAEGGARSNSAFKEKLEREIVAIKHYNWRQVFRSLGLQPGFQYEKYRSSFRLPRLHLDLDETPIGAFLELEGDPSKINLVARALGFAPRDYISATYWDLYAAHCRIHRRTPSHMLFDA